MSEYNIQMNKYNALNAEYDQLYPQPMKHASTHAKDGSDPITPSSIGAAELGADGKVLASQIPSMGYSKPETLSDTTKTLFGLDTTAVPDDAMAVLSRFHKGLGNEYVWKKCIIENIFLYTTTDYSGTRLLSVAGQTMLYSDEFTYDQESENFTLVNPVSFYWAGVGSAATDANVLLGKYVIEGTTNVSTEMKKIDASATFTKGSNNILQVSAFISYTNPHIETTVSNISYVNSPDPNAYPPAVSDGYTYTALGQLGNKVQIATGSYVGTGTYGRSNPNSLTFDEKPIAVMIYAPTQFADKTTLWPYGKTLDVAFQASSAIQMNLTWSGNTVNWYYTGNDARAQLNVSGQTYEYLYVC